MHDALRGAVRVIPRHYLETCATKAIRSAPPVRICDELTKVLSKFAR